MTKSTKIINLPDGTKVHCIQSMEAIVLDDHIKGYFNHGISLQEGDTIVDIGANIGLMGVRVSSWFKDIEIHCFEPIPQIFSALKANAELSKNEKFFCYQMGIGATNEQIEFSYFPNSPALSTSDPSMWENDPNQFRNAVEGSLKNAPKSFWWSKYIPKFLIPLIAWNLKRGEVKVKCEVITLSSFVQRNKIHKIDLLKMDCEGHEWKVLMGIDDLDWPKIKSIVMEVHDIEDRVEKTKALLKSKGFTKLILEKEEALENTALLNLFATR